MNLNTIPPTCPYCKKLSKEITGKELYPHRKDLHSLKFYHCEACDAHVGCHKRSGDPLGRLSNKELRMAKREAHYSFDPIWKRHHISRAKAYGWLCEQLGMSKDMCHIGMFNVEQCKLTAKLSRKWLSNKAKETTLKQQYLTE